MQHQATYRWPPGDSLLRRVQSDRAKIILGVQMPGGRMGAMFKEFDDRT
jgi:hypothetical protein